MLISNNGINLIKHFEGCVLHSYKDSVGVWTIGWGHTAGVHEGMTISQVQADNILISELRNFSASVNHLIHVSVNQNQFDALVSFAYNVGIRALETSTLLEELNKKNYTVAAEEFHKWNHAGGKVLAGLTSRRQAEHDLFVKPIPVPVVHYDVVAGDNLTHIAARFHTSVDELKKLNKLKSDLIKVGEVLQVK